jgi:hypothetical protein
MMDSRTLKAPGGVGVRLLIALAFALALASIVPTISSAAAVTSPTLYGARGSSAASDLYTIDPATGASTSVGPIGMGVTGLAYDSSTGTLYGVTTPKSPLSPLSLVSIDTATGAPTVIGPLENSSATAETIAEIEFDGSGALWGWSESDDNFVRIDTATGEVTDFPSFISTAGDGMAWIPGSDTLWFMPNGSNGDYYSIDRSTGDVTTIGTLDGSGATVAAATQSCDGLTTYALEQGTPATLLTVDYATGSVTSIGATGMNNGDALAWACPAVAPTPPAPPVTPNTPPITPVKPSAPKIYSLGNGAMAYCVIATGNCRVVFKFSVSQASTVTLKITRVYGRRNASQCKTVDPDNRSNGVCSIDKPTYTRTVSAKSGSNKYTFRLPRTATLGHYKVTAQAKNSNGKSNLKKHNFSVPWG